MSQRSPGISESEWLVASVVWNRAGLTASEIAGQLSGNMRWKLKTVNTFLARLVTKGVLAVERDGRAFRYRALIPREQCVREESASFLQRVFGGAVAPMLSYFCETADLTEEDIAALRRILNRKTAADRAPRRGRTKHPKK